MEGELKKTLVYISSLLVCCFSIVKWGTSLYALIGGSSVISQFDFYSSIILAGICFHLFMKIRKESKQCKKYIEDVRVEIKKEVTSLIDTQINEVKQIVANTQEKIVDLGAAVNRLEGYLFNLSTKK